MSSVCARRHRWRLTDSSALIDTKYASPVYHLCHYLPPVIGATESRLCSSITRLVVGRLTRWSIKRDSIATLYNPYVPLRGAI